MVQYDNQPQAYNPDLVTEQYPLRNMTENVVMLGQETKFVSQEVNILIIFIVAS